MITTFLLALISSITMFFINALPTTPAFPTDWGTAVATIWGYFNAWNFLFPVTTLLTVLGLSLIFQASWWAWKGALWTIHLLRGN